MKRTELQWVVTTGTIVNRSWQCPTCKTTYKLTPNKAHGTAKCECSGTSYRLVRPEIVDGTMRVKS